MGQEEGEGGPRRAEDPNDHPIPVPALVLASVGGMLLFMGLFFGLIAALGVGGFLYPALIICIIACLMMLTAWRMWRTVKEERRREEQREREHLLCDYCGGMNAEGDLKCRFCGAPLR